MDLEGRLAHFGCCQSSRERRVQRARPMPRVARVALTKSARGGTCEQAAGGADLGEIERGREQFGKRMANKSERMGARQELMALTRKIHARTRATSPAMVKKLIREAILAACIRPRKKPFQ